MAKTCPNCVYYNTPDTTCRRNPPPVVNSNSVGGYVVSWPIVKTTDWCAQGWNSVDGWYNINWRGQTGGSQQ